MQPVAIGLSGAIGSGKSSLARSLHSRLGGTLASFGDYVRYQAWQMKLTSDRRTLQELGESLVRENGYDLFCEKVLDHFEWHNGTTLVIDGVRHSEVVQSLSRKVHPLRFVLVMVDIDETSRMRRLDNSDRQFIASIDTHSTESQVRDRLVDIANLHVDGSMSIEIATSTIVKWLNEYANP